MWVLSKKQGEHRHFRVDRPVVPIRRILADCLAVAPVLAVKKGSLAAFLLSGTGQRCCCWHARSREAPPCASERWPSLGLRWLEELEFLNFKFLIYFVHPTRLPLVLILGFFFFLILKKKSFEIALNLARKTFAPKLPKEKEK